MSSINSLFGGVGSLNPYASNSQVNRGRDGDGDNDGNRGARGIGKGGAFASAIMQALSQMGVTGASSASSTSGSGTSTTASTDGTTSDSTTTSSTTDPQQALQTFMHDLFAAMHAQGAQNTTASAGTDSDGDNDGSSASAAQGVGGGRHYHGGLSKMENGLQNIIQQLSTGDSSSATGTSNSSVSALQQDFQNLMTAMGGSTSNQASLSDFLKSIATNLQNGRNPGLNISASA
ncbi:uncharacterized protein NMK_0112 [Novimethylophilus kurashikiensis]|uniref:Uncharacterized protein n=1 Tax=Novimethylophilus kurashikiensis TaxID=1825523 RepID=A0A2R5F7B9_9PROT|nr:hypothetical protein [Novimethylophilus kurashikiensis]GBG12581.1 uncharacterized protein NMK_0112 [Novimethylophilus kurashikiensis]